MSTVFCLVALQATRALPLVSIGMDCYQSFSVVALKSKKEYQGIGVLVEAILQVGKTF